MFTDFINVVVCVPPCSAGDEDTQKAFHKHFEQQLDLFKEMVGYFVCVCVCVCVL